MNVYSLLRPLLFCLDPEISHHLALKSLQYAAQAHLLPQVPVVDGASCRVMGLDFANRVGLAAGLDKDGVCIDGMSALGFGFIELGTVTPRPQAGNPEPRLFRLPAAQALINRMGFNNAGVEALLQNIQKRRSAVPLGINIGKNASTPIEQAAQDYLYCLERVYPWASYVTVNISSPNTKNLRELQRSDLFQNLLKALKEKQSALSDKHGKYVPLVIKIAPDLDDESIKDMAESLLRVQIDGVIVSNTTLSREGVSHMKYGQEAGGLSGQPVRARSTAMLTLLKSLVGDELALIGVGGIMSAQDAAQKIKAGAQLVQLYTGLIYEGPALVRACINTTIEATN